MEDRDSSRETREIGCWSHSKNVRNTGQLDGEAMSVRRLASRSERGRRFPSNGCKINLNQIEGGAP